jgi:hypothetical protein
MVSPPHHQPAGALACRCQLHAVDTQEPLRLPTTAESHLTLNAMHEYRVKRISPIAIISGIIGMLMGWIMQLCLNIPRDLLDELQDWQNWLLQI